MEHLTILELKAYSLDAVIKGTKRKLLVRMKHSTREEVESELQRLELDYRQTLKHIGVRYVVDTVRAYNIERLQMRSALLRDIDSPGSINTVGDLSFTENEFPLPPISLN